MAKDCTTTAGIAAVRALLQPGDVLLYSPRGCLSRLVEWKTWSAYSHVEVWLGRGVIGRYLLDLDWTSHTCAQPSYSMPGAEVLASRPGIGVNFYPFDLSGLTLIRRSRDPLDMDAMLRWVTNRHVIGQRYDWWGLLRFFNVGRGRMDRQFCSELAARLLRRGGVQLFNNVDADQVSPGMLAWTRDLYDLWRQAAP